MPRKPKATSPKAKTAHFTSLIAPMSPRPDPVPETRNAAPMRATIATPSQYPEKLPATRPDRMSSDAPPSLALVTTSRT